MNEEFFGAGKECPGGAYEFFPEGHWKSNFLCNLGYGDHGWDPSPPNITALQTGTAWINLAGNTPVQITSTPDNFDFQIFDFHGRFANPVVHP